MCVGETIQSLRAEKGIVQRELAEYLNVSVSTVSNYEVERHFPDVYTLCRLADFYKVNVDYILGRTNIKLDWPIITPLIKNLQGLETAFDFEKRSMIENYILGLK